MFDIESTVFKSINNEIKAKHSNAVVYSEYHRVPPIFPCVQIILVSALTHKPSGDGDNVENNTVVGFQIDVYTKGDNKKSSCQNITATIDEKFLSLGFSRTLLTQTTNLEDASIYRITARYDAVISKDYYVYSN